MRPARLARGASRLAANVSFWLKHRELRRRRKIVLALTPPAYLRNMGDHAQVIAIRRWLDRRLPGVPVVEVDKDDTRRLLPALSRLVGPDDVILLQSGGNLGDRGIWSERIRRLVIESFPATKIVSLPQTIFFSDTPTGRAELENTRRAYATHPDLTIICRDPLSYELGKELFPGARTFAAPDFVLSLDPDQPTPTADPPKGLLCLRSDNETALSTDQREQVAASLPYETRRCDTTLDFDITVDSRTEILESMLDRFRAADFVVTDRFHGLMFAVLCKKPTVVLPSVDHKITSGAEWFRGASFVEFVGDVREVPAALERVLAVESRSAPDWNALYFDALPERAALEMG